MLLPQSSSDDSHTWSVTSLDQVSYRMHIEFGQRSPSGHQQSFDEIKTWLLLPCRILQLILPMFGQNLSYPKFYIGPQQIRFKVHVVVRSVNFLTSEKYCSLFLVSVHRIPIRLGQLYRTLIKTVRLLSMQINQHREFSHSVCYLQKF